MIRYSTEKITPEIAKEMLRWNYGNRPISKPSVRLLAEQMSKGKWHLTGETIIFADSGRLIDGQHRLEAVVQSGCTIEVAVTRGVEEECYKFIDQNRPKGIKDFLSGADRTLLASVGKKILFVKKGFLGNASIKAYNYTTDEAVDFIEENVNIIAKVARLADRCYRHLNFMSKSEIGGIAGFLILFKNHKENVVEDFFMELFFSTNGDKGVEILRNRLIQNKLNRNSHLSSKAKMAIVAKTWNAWLKGEQRKQLRANQDEDIQFD